MKNVTSEDVQPWLGGEAHVRQHDSRWRLPAHWRQNLWLSLAFLAGSTVTGGTAAVIAKARGTPESRPREEEKRSMRRHHHRVGFSTGDVLAVFVAGAVMGAGVALLAAPESGARMRQRLVRGARTAQEELAGVMEGTREALEALTKDARQTLRHTAIRLTDAMEATKEALKSDVDPRKGPARNE